MPPPDPAPVPPRGPSGPRGLERPHHLDDGTAPDGPWSASTGRSPLVVAIAVVVLAAGALVTPASLDGTHGQRYVLGALAVAVGLGVLVGQGLRPRRPSTAVGALLAVALIAGLVGVPAVRWHRFHQSSTDAPGSVVDGVGGLGDDGAVATAGELTVLSLHDARLLVPADGTIRPVAPGPDGRLPDVRPAWGPTGFVAVLAPPGAGARVTAYDRAGRRQWQATLPRAVRTEAVAALPDGTVAVLVCAARFRCDLTALGPTGAVRWTVPGAAGVAWPITGGALAAQLSGSVADGGSGTPGVVTFAAATGRAASQPLPGVRAVTSGPSGAFVVAQTGDQCDIRPLGDGATAGAEVFTAGCSPTGRLAESTVAERIDAVDDGFYFEADDGPVFVDGPTRRGAGVPAGGPTSSAPGWAAVTHSAAGGRVQERDDSDSRRSTYRIEPTDRGRPAIEVHDAWGIEVSATHAVIAHQVDQRTPFGNETAVQYDIISLADGTTCGSWRSTSSRFLAALPGCRALVASSAGWLTLFEGAR